MRIGRLANRHVVAPRSVDIRERRVAQVMEIARRFLYDLGVMLAGGRDGFDEYVAADTLTAMRRTVQPFLAAEVVLRPDFGEYAQLTIEGNLLDVTVPVVAHVEFQNRSSAQRPDGRVIATRRRTLEVTLVTDTAIRTVIGHRFDPGA